MPNLPQNQYNNTSNRYNLIFSSFILGSSATLTKRLRGGAAGDILDVRRPSHSIFFYAEEGGGQELETR